MRSTTTNDPTRRWRRRWPGLLGALLTWRPMKRNQLKAGESYLSAAGGWIFEVESIEAGAVFYTVQQTGQKCQATPAEFAERVKRPVMLIDRPNRCRR